ncbi:hypothetical protein OO014_03020 [Intrasporangium calvum]|uniref:Uncharacterized protein n=1 Tax=Intrasporangium calvum TaxID=53358 RepID=A0ABT5GDB0_9MICO|nr:hypothetical protein [Intrasporangium calvum]MDC5696214.1 hypothetical protein [Intrasporangium calvum]
MSNEFHGEGLHDRAGSHDDLLDEVAANPELARVAFLLTARPSERELSGFDGPLEAFRAHVSAPIPQRRRPSMISTLAGAKLGATIAGIAVGLGGAATVAYVSASTPATPETRATAAATPTQAGAATDAGKDAKGQNDTATPVGPDATGSAAYGLCTAWKGVAQNGKAMESVAFQNLATAAGGEDEIEAFCAEVEAPGESGDRATGKPESAPTGKPESVPSVSPTQRPDATPAPATPDTVPTASPSHPTGRS